ncbi:MAG: pyridoxamine 5'-phosphate oxidase family protein [Bryobacteraceae bacterium]
MNELIEASAVREHYGEPSHMSTAKQLDHLDQYCRDFIALSPLIVMATSDARGRADASPRGDAPGFVAVLDDHTLLIPDRIGNKRADTVLNIMENPHVGLLFLTPGINETLRVNGTVRVTIDPDLLSPLSAAGKLPVCGILVAIEEVFFHCGKPLIRSDFWNPDRRVPRGGFASLGKIMADEIGGSTANEFDRGIEEQYRTRLY